MVKTTDLESHCVHLACGSGLRNVNVSLDLHFLMCDRETIQKMTSEGCMDGFMDEWIGGGGDA